VAVALFLSCGEKEYAFLEKEPPEVPPERSWVIWTVAGVLFGNMLTVNIMAVNVYYSELQREQDMYYYLLGNGATRFEATLPFLRSAVIKSFSPCIANMAVLGIVSFPGTMIGQILGGSMPEVAIKYQLMISVITVVASMLSLVITISLSVRRTFDEFGRLKPIFRKGRNTK